jgi:hypothetical protein
MNLLLPRPAFNLPLAVESEESARCFFEINQPRHAILLGKSRDLTVPVLVNPSQ